MKTLQIKPLSKNAAIEICSWTYEPPYDFYNISTEAVNELLNGTYFGVYNEVDELIGFYCYGLSAQVPGGNYDEQSIDIGLGLKPKYTGNGLGYQFVRNGLNFGRDTFDNNQYRLTVAEFNGRAIKLYAKLGFVKKAQFFNDKNKQIFYIMNYA
jgi:[ribosomal protein S18]-alanine N-acetyltransferase